ncbi:MAG: FecR domain-containing protein [Myxococcota bacterium]|nr:FecR domain-containing protein [Myxococcota bacterium]MDW8363059.1 FecR domain-containing protein [Myxococcales bacterium]
MAEGPLPAPLERLMRPAAREDDVARLWRSLSARRAARSARSATAWRAWAVAAGLLAVGTALVARGISWSSSTHAGPLMLEDGSRPAGWVAAGATLRFEDGSSLQTGADTRAELVENDAGRIVTALRAGRVRFSVVGGGGRRWIVEAGAVTVEVVGTRFEVERTARDVRVEVHHGAVLVRGARVPDGVRRLSAGERLAVPDTATAEGESPSRVADVEAGDAANEVASNQQRDGDRASAETTGSGPRASGETVARGEADDIEPAKPAVPRGRVPLRSVADADRSGSEDGAWRQWLREGQWALAWARLEAVGVEVAVERATDVEELFQIATLARLAGRPRQALVALERAARIGSGPEAAVALFTHGRVLLDELGRPADAARSFEAVARHADAPADLVEAARGRWHEALRRAGLDEEVSGASEAPERDRASRTEGREASASLP